MNIKGIIMDYLKIHGFDGLYCKDKCGCFNDDLFHCDRPQGHSCVAGYRTTDSTGNVIIGEREVQIMRDFTPFILAVPHRGRAEIWFAGRPIEMETALSAYESGLTEIDEGLHDLYIFHTVRSWSEFKETFRDIKKAHPYNWISSLNKMQEHARNTL